MKPIILKVYLFSRHNDIHVYIKKKYRHPVVMEKNIIEGINKFCFYFPVIDFYYSVFFIFFNTFEPFVFFIQYSMTDHNAYLRFDRRYLAWTEFRDRQMTLYLNNILLIIKRF